VYRLLSALGRLAVLMFPLLVTACATTTVRKNPDDCDQGIRYYRPKPFLLIQPSEAGADQYVSISLQYLPDFSEEYSIRVRSGLGINRTKVTLKDGWNLTQIDQDLDAQFDESVRALAELVDALPIPTAGRVDANGSPLVVRATNVPLGFYESIISRGGDGKKRLYGWRYVGFHPFNACPSESCGVDYVDCQPHDIYALVFERGVMTFKQVGQVDPECSHDRQTVEPVSLERLPPPGPPGSRSTEATSGAAEPSLTETAKPALDALRRLTVALLNEAPWGRSITLRQVTARMTDPQRIDLTIRLIPEQLRELPGDPADVARQLEAALTPEARRLLFDDQLVLTVELP
jgi:hypothetical protein